MLEMWKLYMKNYPLFLSNFNKTWIWSIDFLNKLKIRPVEAELFHADGHDEATSRFSKFCESA
jgi:hypothetical protein